MRTKVKFLSALSEINKMSFPKRIKFGNVKSTYVGSPKYYMSSVIIFYILRLPINTSVNGNKLRR